MIDPNLPLPWVCLEAYNRVLDAEDNKAWAEELGLEFTMNSEAHLAEAKERYDALKETHLD